MNRNRSTMAAFALLALLAAPAEAQSPAGWTQTGMLSCRVNPSIGFIIAGHQSMECRFTQNGFPPQAYQGALNMVGLNIGFSAGGALGCAVFSPTVGAPAGALAGEVPIPKPILNQLSGGNMSAPAVAAPSVSASAQSP